MPAYDLRESTREAQTKPARAMSMHRIVAESHWSCAPRLAAFIAASHVMNGSEGSGGKAFAERLYPHPVHQRHHVTTADLALLGRQQASQHPAPSEGSFRFSRTRRRMRLPRLMFRPSAAWSPADRAHGRSSLCAQRADLAERPKKSFSSVGSPTLRAATSRQRLDAHAPLRPPGPKHRQPRLVELRFPRCDLIGVHVELLRQLSQCSIALDGSNRHLRFKAGVWFRRGRLLIVSDCWAPRARCQAETPLVSPVIYVKPALFAKIVGN